MKEHQLNVGIVSEPFLLSKRGIGVTHVSVTHVCQFGDSVSRSCFNLEQIFL